MQLPALNVNTIIIAVLITAALYGLIAGKQRLRIFILSIYVGIVLADQLSSLLAPKLPMLGADQISWLLLGLPILVFGLAGNAHKKAHAKGPAIANLIVGILTGALITSSALKLLPTSAAAAVYNDSFIATNLSQFHIWILGGLPVIVLVLGLIKGKQESH